MTRQEDEIFSIESILGVYFNYNQEQIERFLEVLALLGTELDGFLEGSIFKMPWGIYTREEKKLILRDLTKIVDMQFSGVTPNKSGKSEYTTTAGAPGTGKSTFIENLYGSNPSNAVYIDPDRVALLNMDTYSETKAEFGSDAAYTKWRNASNFIANFMFVKAVTERLNIIHGTTGTNPKVKQIYPALKQYDYDINIHLLFANAESRAQALTHRAGVGVTQVTAEDAKGKVKPVFDRLVDAYIPYADKLKVYMQPSEPYWLGQKGPFSSTMFASKECNGKLQVLLGTQPQFEMLISQLREERCSEDEITGITSLFEVPKSSVGSVVRSAEIKEKPALTPLVNPSESYTPNP